MASHPELDPGSIDSFCEAVSPSSWSLSGLSTGGVRSKSNDSSGSKDEECDIAERTRLGIADRNETLEDFQGVRTPAAARGLQMAWCSAAADPRIGSQCAAPNARRRDSRFVASDKPTHPLLQAARRVLFVWLQQLVLRRRHLRRLQDRPTEPKIRPTSTLQYTCHGARLAHLNIMRTINILTKIPSLMYRHAGSGGLSRSSTAHGQEAPPCFMLPPY